MNATDTIVSRFWELMRKNYAPLGFSIVGTMRLEEWSELNGSTKVNLRWGLRCPCGAREDAAQSFVITDELCVAYPEIILEDMAQGLADGALRLTASREHLEEDVARGTLPATALDGATYDGNLIL